MTCKQGETQAGHTTVTLERDWAVLVFRNVPAEVRANCGEAYVSEEITAQLPEEAEGTVEATFAAPSGETVTLHGLADGEYVVRPFDTWQGTYLWTSEISVQGSSVTVTLPDYERDIALRIEGK